MSSISEFIEIKEIDPTENVTQVKKWLDELAAVKEQIAARAQSFDCVIAKLQEEKAEAIGDELPAAERELTKYIKAETALVTHSIKGTGLQAEWSKGRTSWDTKGLVKLIPEVLDEELKQKFADCQKTGKPSVSIRVVKQAEKVEEAKSLF